MGKHNGECCSIEEIGWQALHKVLLFTDGCRDVVAQRISWIRGNESGKNQQANLSGNNRGFGGLYRGNRFRVFQGNT